MSDLLLLALGASLVNNFVLTHFLGLCPFVGVSRRLEAAAGTAVATLFVLTLASGAGYAAWHWLLEPLGLGYLRTLVFILLLAAVVPLTEMLVRATSPLLHELLGVFLPLITTNCAVLGVALINVDRQHGLVESLVFGASAAAGFGLVLVWAGCLWEPRLLPGITCESLRAPPSWAVCLPPWVTATSEAAALQILEQEKLSMFKKSDFFFLLAIMISFFVSGYLWFGG